MIYNKEQLIDFIYELNNDNENASFPRMTSKERIKNEVHRLSERNNYYLIMDYNDNDDLNGVCIYYTIDEEKYVQTSVFLIKDKYSETAESFINHIKERQQDYTLYTGFPKTNTKAIEFLKNRNFKCIDSSTVTKLFKFNSENKAMNKNIMEINKDNFDSYSAFHDSHALPLEMFYNSDNLKKDLKRFRIYAYKNKSGFQGSIFVKSGTIFEVFGLFVNDNKLTDTLINDMLIRLYNEFDSIDEVLYFINDNDEYELKTALKAGFKITDSYKCFNITL